MNTEILTGLRFVKIIKTGKVARLKTCDPLTQVCEVVHPNGDTTFIQRSQVKRITANEELAFLIAWKTNGSPIGKMPKVESLPVHLPSLPPPSGLDARV